MRNNKNQPPIKNRDASVAVRPDWTTIEEMDFPRLAKLSLPNVKEAEDTLVRCWQGVFICYGLLICQLIIFSGCLY